MACRTLMWSSNSFLIQRARANRKPKPSVPHSTLSGTRPSLCESLCLCNVRFFLGVLWSGGSFYVCFFCVVQCAGGSGTGVCLWRSGTGIAPRGMTSWALCHLASVKYSDVQSAAGLNFSTRMRESIITYPCLTRTCRYLLSNHHCVPLYYSCFHYFFICSSLFVFIKYLDLKSYKLLLCQSIHDVYHHCALE